MASDRTDGIVDLAMRFDVLMEGHDRSPQATQGELAAICVANASLFCGAFYRWISRAELRNSAGCRFLVKMAIEDGYLTPLIADSDAMPLEEALLIAEAMVLVTPTATRSLLAGFLSLDTATSVPPGLFRALEIVAHTDGVGRANSILVQFLRSPNPKVRSRVVDLFIRTTKNQDTAMTLMNDADERVRANVLEALWPHAEALDSQRIFRLHAGSAAPRVATNAMVGLHLGGAAEGAYRLIECLKTPNLAMQRSAAWAMGYLGALQFEEPLRELLRSGDSALRGPVLRALVRINQRTRNRTRADDEISERSALELILRSGSREWNRWRTHCVEPQPSLRGGRLVDFDLSGADLSFCDLRDADLSGSRINLGSLFGADLRNAKLDDCQLCRADLRCAELSEGTSFRNANFHGAALSGLDLDGVDITGAQFEYAAMRPLPPKKSAESAAAPDKNISAA